MDDFKNINCTKEFARHNSEFSDVICETESMGPLPKRLKMTKLDKVVDESHSTSNIEKSSKDTPQKQLCDELNDSFDDAELEKIVSPGKDGSTTSKIRVVSNVLVKNKPNIYEIESNNEDDMFSDDDIVETTPQKTRNNSGDLW